MKNLIFASIILALIGCEAGSHTHVDLDGYTTEHLSKGVTRAFKLSGEMIAEEGFLCNGDKNGVWTTYYEKDGRIKTLETYSAGVMNGVSLLFNKRGQIEKKSMYRDGKLEGIKGEYKFGRPVKETMYVQGIIEGMYREYHTNGKIQKEIEFSNGKRNGGFRQYNDEGKITLEYQYKDDEKISGGIVE